jgi:chromosomal replication initiator protein
MNNSEIVAPLFSASPERDVAIADGGAASHPSIAEIQRAVASYFGIQRYEMVSARRSRKVAWPRQVAMYLTRDLTPFSFPHIGRHFGRRDHTTIMHGVACVEARIGVDPMLALAVEKLTDELCSGAPPWRGHEMSERERFVDAVRGSTMLRQALLRLAA